MELSDLVKQYGSQQALAEALGVNPTALNRVIKGRRPLGAKLAITVFAKTGHRIGPMAEVSEAA